MLFSIVIPIYNVEKYLKECIDSFLNQDFDDYEIILVNDGSNDKSGEICDQYALQYPFIHAIHQENGGQAKARNVGTVKACGDYVVYIDSDDYIRGSHFLSSLVAHCEKTNNLNLCNIV